MKKALNSKSSRIASRLVFASMFALAGAPSAQAADCSNANLNGSYGGYSNATVVPALTPRVALIRSTYDGKGNLSGAVTTNDNGMVTHGTFSGTYEVNADCSGTLSIGLATFEIVLVDGGKEFYEIRTDPPDQVLYGVFKKQFPDEKD